MAILNYTTQIKVEKTIMEIQQILVKHGANKIVTDYDGENPTSVTFCLLLNGQVVGYSLPANYAGVLKALRNDGKVPRKLHTEEQALRVSWRIILYWVKAQMAILEAEMVTMDQIFLPYIMAKDGKTFYETLVNSKFQITGGTK